MGAGGLLKTPRGISSSGVFGIAFAACALLGDAQSRPHNAGNVVLNVTALDTKGQPVTALTGADFEIFDDGKRQTISTFKGPEAATAGIEPTTVILFDLLNVVPAQREYTATLLTRALEPLEKADSIYLYLLTNHGDLFPVRGLVRGPDPTLEGEHWNKFTRGLLDGAIQKVYGLRPMNDRDPGARAGNTFQILDEVARLIEPVPGPKTIIWITAGAENWMHPYACKDLLLRSAAGLWVAGKCRTGCMKWNDGKCIDFAPFLEHLGTALNRSGTVLDSVEYTMKGLPAADPGSPHDTLEQLANLTGGRMYSGGDVEKAVTQALRNAPARYQITFTPPPANGKYHKLRVVCLNKSVRIESKRGYYAYADQMRQ
jgi:VWFA-related protein